MEAKFIHEFPLVFNEKDFSVLGKRLNAARQLYNACLGECKKKIKLIRESKKWQKAYSLYKSKKKEQIK